jgi:uncharacterized protein (TIGR02145 family)
MKHLLTLALLLCLGTFASAQIPSYVPPNGLVGWWPFNGNANDESGNGNNGTVNGATLAADRFGNASKAYFFNGNSSITVPNNSTLNLSNFSINAWVYLQNFNGPAHEVLTKGCDLGENYEFLIYGPVDSGAVETAILFSNGSRSGTSGSGIPNNCINKTNSLKWHFLTATFDVGTGYLRTYIDGVPNCIDLLNRTPQANSSPLTIGREPCFSGRELLGKIDDIAIYNRALSPAEVQQLYLGNCTQPTFTAQPQNKSVGQGQTTTFAVQVDTTATFQWQMDNGFGFVNLVNSSLFSGVTTNTLTVKGSNSIDGYSFRCIATACQSDTSNAATLTVTSNASTLGSLAGVPGKINYQGAAMDSLGKPMKNQTIALQLSVLDSSSTGAAAYVESHSTPTNGSGMFSLQIGGGTAVTGMFDSIPWANGRNKYLKTEVQQNGTWVNLGTSQLVSVPYALHAGSAENAKRSQFILDDNNREIKLSSRNGNFEFNFNQDTIRPSNLFNCGVSKINYLGQDYQTVLIGTQCWLAKNLDVGMYKIITSNADSQSNDGIMEKYCMNNTQINCVQNGGLYQWAEALNYNNVNNFSFSGNIIPQRGICPVGWHIPTDYEFNNLNTFLGLNAGQKIKSLSSAWANPPSSSNNSGFYAVTSGYANPYSSTNTFFQGIGNQGGNISFFWSSSENNATVSSCIQISDSNDLISFTSCNKKRGVSVRCLKD